MKQVVRTFVEGVAQMLVAKRDAGYASHDELDAFVRLLTGIDWSAAERPVPPPATILGLRHLQDAVAGAYRFGPCPIVDALRPCIGLTH